MRKLLILICLALAAGIPAGTAVHGRAVLVPRNLARVSQHRVVRAVAGSFSYISAGQISACGIEVSGILACWGDDTAKESEPPAGTFTQVSVGGPGWPRNQESCAISGSGSLSCWGSGLSAAQTSVPAGSFAQVSVGADDSGSVPASYQCGLKTSGVIVCWHLDGSRLVAQTHAGSFLEVSAGQNSSCAIKSDESLICFGNSTLSAGVPAGSFVQVAVWRAFGAPFACALSTAESVTCWGDDSLGQTNAPAGNFIGLTVGGDFGCAVAPSGVPTCWGGDPPPYPPTASYTQVVGGLDFLCGLEAGGSVLCTGDTASGVGEPPGAAFSQVSAGTCAIRTDGSLDCWDGFAQTPLPTGTFANVSVGEGVQPLACGVETAGAFDCWSDASGAISGILPGSYSGGSAGFDAACAVTATGGTIRCLGNISAPPGAGPYQQVSVGRGYAGAFACAIAVGGELTCWGDDRGLTGQTDGQTEPPGGSFSQVSAGAFGACALRSADGSMACWGQDSDAVSGEFTSLGIGGDLQTAGRYVCGVDVGGNVDCRGQWQSQPLGVGNFTSVSVDTADEVCGLGPGGQYSCWNPGGSVVGQPIVQPPQGGAGLDEGWDNPRLM